MALIAVFGSHGYLVENGDYTSPFIYPSEGDIISSKLREVCQHYLYGHSLNIVRQQQVSDHRSTSTFSSIPQIDKKNELGQSPTADMFIAPPEQEQNPTNNESLASTTAVISETRVCPGCGKQMNRKLDVTRHLESSCPQGLHRTFECPEPGCGKKYTRPDAVIRHQRSRHGAAKRRPGRKMGLKL